MFKRKSEEEIREEVDPNRNATMQNGEETEAGNAPEEAEAPGTGNGEGTAGDPVEETKQEEARRRNTAEREELATYVTISVVNKFLQILDNFERAEAAAENATDVQSVVDGMAGIQKQFVKTLEDLGVKEIPAQGEKFNPNFHEAVMRGQNPEMEDETIDMVFEKGYQLHDKVVRHSKVRVISNE